MRALLLVALAAAFVPPAGQGGGDLVMPRGADAWTLFRGLTRHATVEVVCAEAELRPYVAHALERSRSLAGQHLVLVTPAESDSALPRIVVGSLRDPWIARLARKAGLTSADGVALRLGGADLRRPSEVLVATVADPEREGLPLTMHLGNAARTLAADLDNVVPHWRPGLFARRRGLPQKSVPLRPNGTPDWDRQVDYDALRRGPSAGTGAALIRVGDRIAVRASEGVDPARAAAYAELAGRADAAVRAAFGRGRVKSKSELFLIPSVDVAQERFGLSDLSRVAAFEPSSALVLLAPGLPHDGGASAARAAALGVLGPTCAGWMLDGLGTAYAESWWGRPREAWAAFVREAGFAPTAAELAQPDADARISPHVLGPLRGELFALLLRLLGAEATARLWTGADELVCDAALERAFQDRLDALVERYGDALASARAERRAAAAAIGWLGGVHMSPAGGDLDHAFSTDTLYQSLAAAAAAGATSAAFTPIVFLEPRENAFAGEPLRRRPDGSPGDLALAHALNSARLVGLDTMLAPEIVGSPTGTWFDAIALGAADEVREAFAQATRALEHYGLLAELCGVDVLCLASECSVISVTRPLAGDNAQTLARFALMRAEWGKLIPRVRGAFPGALTYSAEPLTEPLSELERVEFWPELDFVGIALFPQLSRPNGRSLQAMAEHRLADILSNAARVAAEVGRPLLIVQTGFPSSTTAHRSPLLASGAVDVDQQASLYAVLADVVEAARARAELAGVFLWRWDPDATAGGPSDPSHTPQGKPAERELRRLLGR
jgi:hypothetical protein